MKIILLAGVTGSGKTSLALRLLDHRNFHLISVDSVQIYKFPTIFSNKPTNVSSHAMIDSCDFNDLYDVEAFIKQCYIEINYAKENNKIPLLVGGTGLYFSRLHFEKDEVLKIFLTQKRHKLYKKLDQRCEEMVMNGGLDEIIEMKNKGFEFDSRIGRSIGCRDAVIYIEKMIKNKEDPNVLFNEFMDSFRKRTRNYARKQECWFKKDKFYWADINKYDAYNIINKFLDGNLDSGELERMDNESRKTNVNANKEMKTYVNEYKMLTKEKIEKIVNNICKKL